MSGYEIGGFAMAGAITGAFATALRFSWWCRREMRRIEEYRQRLDAREDRSLEDIAYTLARYSAVLETRRLQVEGDALLGATVGLYVVNGAS